MSDNITINVSGGKQNQVAGKIENHNSTIGDTMAGELTVAKFFESIEAEVKKLPEVEQQEIKQAVEPLKEIATGQAEASKPEQTSFSKYLDMLRPHAGLITRCVAAFSEAVLIKLADTDPSGVISGVLAVSREVRSAGK